ncbi:MAG: hypothetical protein QNL18_13345 [Pseudomonadales bacterium]|jgi:hypothetical protein|tara:strand:+ start:407 stop:1384 length:978 start_codon:yes stop_codon:yes gene_type:complete
MMYLKILVIALGVFTAHVSRAEDYIEWVAANSGVNWTNGSAVAEGAGLAKPGTPPSLAKMMACRAALVDGQRNLLESLQGVRVEGITMVDKLMLESDLIKSSVEGTLKGAVMTSRRPQADGTCEVTLTAPIAGNFARDIYQTVLAPNEQSSTPMKSAIQQALFSTIDYVLGAVASSAQANESDIDTVVAQLTRRLDALEAMMTDQKGLPKAGRGKPTGLVIDARGSNFIPSMSPKIRKLRAGVIYPSISNQQALADRGQLVSLFTRDVETAQQHPIVGARPVVLKALRTWGDTRTEIVLNSEGSRRLEKMIQDGIMQDAGVIIVL